MENTLKTIFVPKNLKVAETSILALAFLGDAVFSLVARKTVLDQGFEKAGNLHRLSSRLCSAVGQSEILDKILLVLDEEEQNLVRRARNTKTHKPPKSAGLEEYKKATALEALLGYLLVKENFERIQTLLNLGLENIKEKIC